MPEPTYLIYQIQNNINGKIYIGAHCGTPNDRYMGSGNAIRAAIKKYGKANFTKTVLCECTDSESMYAKEAELVDDAFVTRKDTYNVKHGGIGGFAWSQKEKDAHKNDWTQERRNITSSRLMGKGVKIGTWTQEHKNANRSSWTHERRESARTRLIAYWTRERKDEASVRLTAYWAQKRKPPNP